MSSIVIGASKGLGLALVKELLHKYSSVYATIRSSTSDDLSKTSAKIIPDIDITDPTKIQKLNSSLSNVKDIEYVFITAGVFIKESFDELDWEAQVKMYTTSSIAPVFIVKSLQSHLSSSAKIFLISSESGSITLRHKSEGGGNYGHHASKAATNMVGKLLSLDIDNPVGIIHPGFMRTEMTKSVGFDEFWDDGGAVTPDEAAKSLIKFSEGFKKEQSGSYWAPRGIKDIGTAKEVLSDPPKDESAPFNIPW